MQRGGFPGRGAGSDRGRGTSGGDRGRGGYSGAGDRGRGGYSGGGDRGGYSGGGDRGRGGYSGGGDRGRGGYSGGDRGGFSGDRGRGGYEGRGRGGFDAGRGRGRAGDDGFTDSPMPMSKRAPILRQDFGVGSTGRKIDLISNFYPMVATPVNVFQYEVNIKPLDRPRRSEEGGSGDQPERQFTEEEKNDKERRMTKFIDRHSPELIKKFLALSTIPNEQYAFDGSKLLYFKRSFPFELRRNVEHSCNGRPVTFEVSLKFVKSFDTAEVAKYYAKESADIPENLISLFEIVTKDSFKGKYAHWQNKNFDFSTIHAKAGMDDVQFVSGFKSVVSQTQSGLALNVHLKTACLLNQRFVSLLDLYSAKVGPVTPTVQSLADINSLIRHLEVETRHGRPMTYKIDKIVDKLPADVKFDNAGQPNQTISDYFLRKYQISCNPNLPVVKVQLRKETFLPLELCYLKSRQFLANQKITPLIQRELLSKSTNAPNVYFKKLEKLVQNVSIEECARLQSEFGLRIENIPMQISGRILTAPVINRGGRNDPFSAPAKNSNICIVSLDPTITEKDLSKFAEELRSTARRFGLELKQNYCKVVAVRGLPQVKDLMANIHRQHPNHLVIVAIPRAAGSMKGSEIYNNVKFYSEKVFKFVTQCIKSEYITRPPRGYHENLLLKVNGKMGGKNSTYDARAFDSAVLGFNSKESMVIAYDVNHPAVGESSEQSVAAVVGTTDSLFSDFVSTLSQQTRMRNEIVSTIEDHVTNLLQSYKSVNKNFPKNLLIFRDGVGEGQFDDVRKVEIASIDSALKKLGVTANILFLVVQKIHSARFAAVTPYAAGNKSTYNVPSGTVVDSGIVSSKFQNFYLNSHFSPLGTSKPTHYYVLRNDLKLTMDQIQTFVFRCCFNCIRARIPLSIPLAIRYADLCAFRGKTWFEASHHSGDPELASNTSFKRIEIPAELSRSLFYC